MPRLPWNSPREQLAALEFELLDRLAGQAHGPRAADVEFQLAELIEGRGEDEPLRQRVEYVLANRAGKRGRPPRGRQRTVK